MISESWEEHMNLVWGSIIDVDVENAIEHYLTSLKGGNDYDAMDRLRIQFSFQLDNQLTKK